jgi:hypothetical protein
MLGKRNPHALLVEMSQGNYLYSYLNQQKCQKKKKEQEGKTGPVWEVDTSG